MIINKREANQSGFYLEIQKNAWWEGFHNQAIVILSFMRQFEPHSDRSTSSIYFKSNFPSEKEIAEAGEAYKNDIHKIINAFQFIVDEEFDLHEDEVKEGLKLYADLFLTFWD